jgi:hypothetical protein
MKVITPPQDSLINGVLPKSKSAFGEMLRQAQHDSSLRNSTIPRVSSRAKSRDLLLGNTPLRAN